MAPSCRIPDRERYTRMAIGSTFVTGGFLMSHDVFVRLTLVTVGSAMTAAAALGH
jgi:hypothetical protein